MACTLLDCAKCCTIFSLSGLFFLIIIGSLLQTQPLYIKGPDDPSAAAQGCYQGAIIYLGFFVVSLAYWIFDTLRKKAIDALNAPPSPRSPSRRKNGGQYGALQREEEQY